MTLPELRGAIGVILDREGESPSAAKQIRQLIEIERRLVDLKVAPELLGVTERTMFRWLKSGRLFSETIDGRRMVDVSKMSVRESGSEPATVRT